MNPKIVAMLKEMSIMHEALGDTYRARAYHNAAQNIDTLEYVIGPRNLAGLGDVPGVGKSILAKIGEFVTTGRVRDLEKLKKSKEYRAFDILGGILGVGPAAVRLWIRRGIVDLPSLRRAVAHGDVVLNNMQQYGLRYYTDLHTRIPRAEVTAIAAQLERAMRAIAADVTFTVAGSYRRGSITSGDIDILVTGESGLLGKFIESLRTNDPGFVDVLSGGKERVTFLYKNISGASHAQCVRQVDILNLPPENYFAGLLYFTGDYEYNQAMRGYARARGFRLNQNGLYKVMRGGKLELIPCRSEQEIFRLLGLDYLEPQLRNGTAAAALLTRKKININ